MELHPVEIDVFEMQRKVTPLVVLHAEEVQIAPGLASRSRLVERFTQTVAQHTLNVARDRSAKNTDRQRDLVLDAVSRDCFVAPSSTEQLDHARIDAHEPEANAAAVARPHHARSLERKPRTIW